MIPMIATAHGLQPAPKAAETVTHNLSIDGTQPKGADEIFNPTRGTCSCGHWASGRGIPEAKIQRMHASHLSDVETNRRLDAERAKQGG